MPPPAFSPESSRPGTVTLLGVPCDAHSSHLRGAAAAPSVIRSALFDPGSSITTEAGRALADESRFTDAGDIPLDGATDDIGTIQRSAAAVLAGGARVLALGGDHAVSFPLVGALHAAHGPFAIVQIDAHPDLYDEYDGDRHSHACPFARIMERGLATRLVQVGIRAGTPHQREQAARFGVETLTVDDVRALPAGLPEGPVYLSLDLDGLDPAFVPGVAHPEPGGLTPRDAIRLVRLLPGPLIGADVVELNPRCDVRGATATVAAKLVREIAGRMLDDLP